jgi:hypothetical protein
VTYLAFFHRSFLKMSRHEQEQSSNTKSGSTTFRFFFCMLIAGVLTCFCPAEDFGITQKAFSLQAGGAHTVFTFRNHVLIHEVTLQAERPPWRNSWVERFFANGEEVFLRAGSAQLSSAQYSGSAHVSITRGGQRLSVGSETFNLGEDGFYHVIKDPQTFLLGSVIEDPVFESRALHQMRQEYLDEAKAHASSDRHISPTIADSYFLESIGLQQPDFLGNGPHRKIETPPKP